jgi:hypothetical protein
MPKSLRHHAKHIDTKLRFRLRIYIAISIILVGLLIYNVATGALRIDLGLLGLAGGILIGIVTSRMFHTSWNHDTQKVVSRLDIFGVGILILYIFFELFRDPIVGYFTHDTQVGTVGFAVLAGSMFGRVLGTRGQIMKILREQEVF